MNVLNLRRSNFNNALANYMMKPLKSTYLPQCAHGRPLSDP